MIATLHWPTASVGAFFSEVPWQGSMALEVSSSAVPLDWRQMSVRAFFSDLAWDGHFLQSYPGEVFTLSYLQSVQSFFGCFDWKGRPTIGAIPQSTLRPTKAPELSLSDLSDLF